MKCTSSHLVKALIFVQVATALGAYEPVREYAGSTFFSRWDSLSHGYDEETALGKVSSIDRDTSIQQKLTFVDPSTGHTIIRVEDPATDESVRITSKDVYSVGSLIVVDAVNASPPLRVQSHEHEHTNEISVGNETAVKPAATRTDSSGYTQSPADNDAGTSSRNRYILKDGSCSIEESLAKTGGGIFAVQIDVSGVLMWFWNRSEVPVSIAQPEMHAIAGIADWGRPSAICRVADRQSRKYRLVLEAAACATGQRRESVSQMHDNETCFGRCRSVMTNEENDYSNAYWEISYVRTFTEQVQEMPKPRLLPRQTIAVATIATLATLQSESAPNLVSRVSGPTATIRPDTIGSTSTKTNVGITAATPLTTEFSFSISGIETETGTVTAATVKIFD
ncbi:hypothetical protein VNI00_005247 [Paramarasmius palmivorus]|uniref:Uncharacterized protein n=1 Tax=Paramarasmius palmivorus TaxID=297713 RepID=A0AAW0DEL4_9AGAR